MSVELRWAVAPGTTTEPPRLQYRARGAWPQAAGEWVDVPFVVVDAKQPAQPQEADRPRDWQGLPLPGLPVWNPTQG